MSHRGAHFTSNSCLNELVWLSCLCRWKHRSTSFKHFCFVKQLSRLATIVSVLQLESQQPAVISRLSHSCSERLRRSTGGKGSAFALAKTLGAVTAIQQVCQEGDPLAMGGVPAGPLAPGPTTQEILQILCEQSISAAGRKAVGVAIAAVPGALQRLMTLMQVWRATCSVCHVAHICTCHDSKMHDPNYAGSSCRLRLPTGPTGIFSIDS